MGVHLHLLLEKNPELRTGLCAVCGPCGINLAGKGNFVCNRLPGPARPPRERVAPKGPPHTLSNVNRTDMVADCAVCGPAARVRRKVDRRRAAGETFYCLSPRLVRPDERHGLSSYERLEYIKQHGEFCDICSSPTPKHRGWCIDHCHETGEIRGVLCGPCNRGIGLLGDDADRLLAAAAYLLSASVNSKTRQTVSLADYRGGM